MLVPWLKAFVLTLVMEVPLAAVFLKRYQPRWWRLLGLLAWANLATHPVVWFVFPMMDLHSRSAWLTRWMLTILSEIFAFVAEGVFFKLAFPQATWRRAMGVSFLANAVSFGIGLMMYYGLPRGWMY